MWDMANRRLHVDKRVVDSLLILVENANNRYCQDAEEIEATVRASQLLDRLTRKQKRVAELAAMGYKQREISSLLKVSQQAISRILRRAVARIERAKEKNKAQATRYFHSSEYNAGTI